MKTPKKLKSEKFQEEETVGQKKSKTYPKSKNPKFFDDDDDEMGIEDFKSLEDLYFEEDDDEY